MKRIAFFVEGQTELIFVNRLVRDILGTKNINIIHKQYFGGATIPKQEIMRSLSLSRHPLYEVLICNCGSDNRVKSEMLENMKNLRERGYQMIIGLRDLYPLPIEDLIKLEKGLKFLPNDLRSDKYHFDIVVAVHEIEAWFLAETNHLKKLDKRLTGQYVRENLGFNPYTTPADEREHPAKDLSDIYQLVGRSYTKSFWQVSKLVNRLDFDNIRQYIRYQIKPLDKLIGIIEKFKGNK